MNDTLVWWDWDDTIVWDIDESEPINTTLVLSTQERLLILSTALDIRLPNQNKMDFSPISDILTNRSEDNINEEFEEKLARLMFLLSDIWENLVQKRWQEIYDNDMIQSFFSELGDRKDLTLIDIFQSFEELADRLWIK